MTNSPKLLFDECVGTPLVEQLRALLKTSVEDNAADLFHILEIYKQQGTKDEIWVPHIAAGGYLVITQDLGRSGGAKLPRLCLQHGITHVLLSPAMGSRKMFEKTLSILSVWYDLLALASESPGSRFQLEPNGPGKGKLVRKETKALPGPPPPPPGKLF